jgi:acyl carrier protein
MVKLQFLPTAKNQPALEFLETLNVPSPPRTGENGNSYTIPVAYAATVSYNTGPVIAPTTHREPGHRSVNRSPLAWARINALCRIANELRTSEQIHSAISAWGSAPATGKVQSPDQEEAEVSFSPVEQAIADIWSEVLGVTTVHFDEDFFHLGGDSLRAALVITRLRQVFGVVLALDNIFEAPTVAGLAVVVLERLAESFEHEEMVSLLADFRDS